MKRDNRKVDWEFRVKMTEDLYFMVEKRIDTMLSIYDMFFRHEILNRPPRIQITVWANKEEELREFGELLDTLSMFDTHVYPCHSGQGKGYEYKRIYVMYYQFDEYSYQKEK